jgi:hypothetical protein
MVDENGCPTEVQFFVQGKLDSAAPLSCSVSDAQKIAEEVVTQLIPDTPHWQSRRGAARPGQFLWALSVISSRIRLGFGVDVVRGVVGPLPRIGPTVIEKVAIYLLSLFFGDESRE